MSFDFSKVQDASKAIADKASSFSGPRNFIYFRLPNDGDEGNVRFISAEAAYCHQVTMQNKKYPDWVPSLDQSQPYVDMTSTCPMAQAGLRRALRGWISVIWRDAPLYKRDDDGRMLKDQMGNLVQVGVQDQVAVWTVGIQVMEELSAINAKYKGLSSRDFTITRKGQGLKTSWSILPADVDSGPQPMSSDDDKLAADAPDLKEFSVAPDSDKVRSMISGAPQDQGGASGNLEQAMNTNPFMRKR